MLHLLDVLVVEDDTISAHALCTLLSQVGMRVEAAATVAGAIYMLDKMPHLILLDLDLPDGSGLEILREIRELRLMTRVVIMSACDDTATLEQVLSLKPDRILRKPIDVEWILGWIQAARTEGRTQSLSSAGISPPLFAIHNDDRADGETIVSRAS